MTTIKLENMNKIYDNNVQAVFDFNLDIEDQEFIVFVGPSGCGKSTTLRMIAGLEEISSGNLFINDKLMNEVSPKDRNIAMVFQSYALYPHMTVYENMAFGLKLRKLEKDEIDLRVRKAAEMLQLTDYLDRKPKALSGGQRQRVALGRAIVRQADIFLMDEPLSNLDAKLRVQMRTEITLLHEKLHTTTIYVTHDQVEAMSMADRIVVMKDGYIQQVGTPDEIYYSPTNIFVASFIGTPAMNFIDGDLEDGYISFNKYKMDISHFPEKIKLQEGTKKIVLGIRPEDIKLYPGQGYDFEIEGKIINIEKLGDETIIHLEFSGNKNLQIKTSGKERDIDIGEVKKLYINPYFIHIFEAKTGNRLF
ncbi:MAG: sn-glycerol-3-phosphate ABC transporter ATP-binding protein UgpC [Peptoniphilaceae bacterium]|nr:sn-glycerol-3-phosphate ABC transporter ATP-binding protein UgpC [Peptoniphilaceae bacterium]MDY6019250.1 sn-glycerol-3-phosphate ABC transporter ATP-binding protein UgpC [Anaerococcus sp.]